MKHSNKSYYWLTALLCTVLSVGCSTTKNLPEEEVLYIGIKEIDYGQKEKKKSPKGPGEEGVITSIAEAYKAVDEALTRKDLSALKKEGLTQAQQDSIKEVERIEEEAYETAKTEVDAALAYAPNNSLFGSSKYRIPFPTGLWVYNATVGKKSKLARWIFDTFAATPVYVSTVNPKTRALVAQNTLRNYGYFNGTVDYEILPEKNPRKAKISYTVRPRNLFRLDSIAYLHFPAVGDSLLRRTFHQRNLFSGDPFSVINLDAERTRIYNLFRNVGYYYYKPEYITFRADTIQRPGFVQLQVVPAEGIPAAANKRYRLGRTTISLFGNESPGLTDTLRLRDYTIYYNGGKKGKIPLRFGALRRNMFYRKGMLYRAAEEIFGPRDQVFSIVLPKEERYHV